MFFCENRARILSSDASENEKNEEKKLIKPLGKNLCLTFNRFSFWNKTRNKVELNAKTKGKK